MDEGRDVVQWIVKKVGGDSEPAPFPSNPLPHLSQGGANRVFGKPCSCPLPKTGRFDENGENDEFAFYPLRTRVSLLRPLKATKMTKWRKSLRRRHGLEKAGFVLP